MILQRLHDAIVFGLHVERRFEPFFRPAVDAVLREPLAALIQALINARRRDEGLGIAEEREQPDEAAHLDSIIATMAEYMRRHYVPGTYERAGNTKTHGILRGEVIIRDDLPPRLRHGVFAAARRHPAWVRFSGPGPDMPADIDDVGFVSIAIKMMGVPGPKLLEDESHTQDLLAICTPTFVTPDTRANAKLQQWILKGTPLFYFADPRDSHLLDGLMQSLWNKTQNNPLDARYYSCVPYLLGEGQAMLYSVRPRERLYTKIPRLPLRPPDNYLRLAMVRTLAERDVEFDILLQLQTDPFRMPVENAAVRWPERLSPFVPAATLRIPRQVFDTPAQMDFAKQLSFNPWHCVPEHRPLGNQSRARRRMYWELSRFRQQMNAAPHIEPTGDEVFN
ncbi:MAG TPA: catalase family protein [Acetobacteraceae bacterium]|nr:catalase family protein [Acetobacteraceae bacterium]